MKLLKSIIYIFIITLTLSCAQEYDKVVILPDTSTIIGTISVDGEQFTSGLSVPFTFTLPQGFAKKAIVTVQAESAEYATTNATVTIDAGATTGSGTITLPAASGSLKSFDAVMNFATVTIAGVSTVDEIDTDGTIELVAASDDTTLVTSNEVSLSYYNQIASNALPDNTMAYLVDWSDPEKYDVDIEVIDRAFTAFFETSYTGTRYESDFFNSFHPDGEYDMYARVYAADNPTTEAIPFKIFTLHPDGTRDLLEGELPAGSDGAGTRFAIAAITKTDGNTYSISLY